MRIVKSHFTFSIVSLGDVPLPMHPGGCRWMKPPLGGIVCTAGVRGMASERASARAPAAVRILAIVCMHPEKLKQGGHNF